MTLVEQIRILSARRAALAIELAEIDAQFAEMRAVFTDVDGAPSRPASLPVHEPHVITTPEWQQPKQCEQCGTRFSPSVGSSGRFCSRECYAGGMSIPDRRAAILETLANGPLFPGAIHERVPGISRSTITNDLTWLSKAGKIENCQDGWRLKAAESEDAGEAAAPDPLDQSRRSPMSSAS